MYAVICKKEKKGDGLFKHVCLDMPRKFLVGHLRNEYQRLPLRRETGELGRNFVCHSVPFHGA